MNTHRQLYNLGFDVWETGGGCRCFGKYLEDGGEILITGTDDVDLPDTTNHIVMLAVVNDEGDLIHEPTSVDVELLSITVDAIECGEPW